MAYEKNLNALKDRYSVIYDVMLSERDAVMDGVCVEEAKNGQGIVKYSAQGREYYLNSKYNPSREAEKYMEDVICVPDEAVLTIVGLANGSYLREYVEKNDSHSICVVYEPSLTIFTEVIKYIDISDLIMDERVLFVVGGVNELDFASAMSKLILVHNRNLNKHIVLPKYKELFPEVCDDVVRILNECYSKVEALNTTLRANSKRICQNNIMNMEYLAGCRTAQQYINKFPDDFPAVIVSAGPSLNKNIHLLKEIKDKAILVVVDTAIPKVINAGIVPDVIISVDFEKSLKHFKTGDLKDIFFMAHIDTNTQVLDYVKPNNIIFNSADSLLWEKLFKQAGSSIYEVEAGGSVSTAAIGYMLSWGIKNIILVGQDLALTGNVVHAGEVETRQEDIGWDTVYVKDVDGNDILTRKDYCAYIRWIEDIAYQGRNEISIIDATEGGALIQNTRIMTLREAIDKYCLTEFNVREVLESAPRLFNNDEKRILIDGLQELKHNLTNLKRQFVEVALECHKGAVMLERGDISVKELKQINSLLEKVGDKFLESTERIYLVKYAAEADLDYYDDIYHEEDDDLKEAIRLYNNSEKYYKALTDAIPELIQIIDRCLVKL